MDSPIHSSFIPTQESVPSARDIDYGKSASDIFVLLGLIALVVAGAVSAGVFLYAQFATSKLAAEQDQLKLGQKSFSTDAITQLMRLDDRLRLGESILGSHTAPSVLFAILQETTLQSVQFTNLDYAQSTPNDIKVTMKGKARTVNAIALQANTFSRHAAIKDPIFQINEFTKDGVTFTVTMMLNAEVIRFQSLIEASRSAQPREQVQDQGTDQMQPQAAPTTTAPPQQQRQAPPPTKPQPAAKDVQGGFGSFNE
jgi:hypothetical protein